MNICVIDSGVNKKNITYHPSNKIRLFKCDKDVLEIDDDVDQVGHGTAVTNIILKEIINVNILHFKIFGNELICSEDVLIMTLNYIYKNIDCEIIHLSLGITAPEKYRELENIFLKLTKKQSIIISAFDNDGAISYPAAFDFVIGVDSDYNFEKEKPFKILTGSVVDTLAFGSNQRVAWADTKFMLVAGASYAAAHFTNKAVKYLQEYPNIKNKELLLTKFIEDGYKTIDLTRNNLPNSSNTFQINKAIIIPFNKEIHSFINFQDLLNFKIQGIYDFPKLGNVGKKIYPLNNNKSHHTIKNFNDVDWESDFDTIIVGHLSEIEKSLGTDLKEIIVKLALKYNKNIYSFDSFDNYHNNDKKIFFEHPKKNHLDIDQNLLGKLYQYSTPLLGVFGTSSKQGKFTLQLNLRKRFLRDGYKIAQIGTEPQSLLFGLNEVIPMGYNSSVFMSQEEFYLLVNQIIHKIDIQENDLIILGAQSGTIAYAQNNLKFIPFKQVEYLYAANPDAIILCINSYDDVDYVERTINVIQGIGETKVIALAIYPFKFSGNWNKFINKKSILSKDEIANLIKIFTNKFSIPTYVMKQESDFEEIYIRVVNFFTKGENTIDKV